MLFAKVAMVTEALKKNSDVFLCDRNIISSSSEIFENLRKFSASVQKWLIGLGQLLDNLQKSLKNRLKSFHWYAYIVNRISCSSRYITCSQDSLMRLDIKLNTWREIPYLHAPMYYPLYIRLSILLIIFLMYVWVPQVGNTSDTPNPPWVLPL